MIRISRRGRKETETEPGAAARLASGSARVLPGEYFTTVCNIRSQRGLRNIYLCDVLGAGRVHSAVALSAASRLNTAAVCSATDLSTTLSYNSTAIAITPTLRKYLSVLL